MSSIFIFLCFSCSIFSVDKTTAKSASSSSKKNTIPVWPTDNPAFLKNQPLAAYIQPTVSGDVTSGTYGCVRNNGNRFHSGIDIKSIHRNRKQVPQDNVFACLPGTIVYLNTDPVRSNFGRYVVVEHYLENLHFYSSYAHLASIDPTLRQGLNVEAGHRLGTLGTSSNCTRIPNARAHLHFELGLKLGSIETFQAWYNAQKFSTPNWHRDWNGLNLFGIDPLAFFQSHLSFLDFLRTQTIAFTLDIFTCKQPKFIQQNKALLKPSSKTKKVQTGWRIDFNWAGLPLSWEALYQTNPKVIVLHTYDKNELTRHGNRHTLEFKSNGQPFIGKTLRRQLFCLFGENFSL